MKNDTLPPQEYMSHQTAKHVFGLSRSYLYILANEGKIRSVSTCKEGATRGKRLFDAASIRAFLNSQIA